jgi:hypothetical protein
MCPNDNDDDDDDVSAEQHELFDLLCQTVKHANHKK